MVASDVGCPGRHSRPHDQNVGSPKGISRGCPGAKISTETMAPTASRTDPRFAEIEGHRAYHVRYALSQLRDSAQAEEAVQEALLAALEGIGRFEGKSSLRISLLSILCLMLV